MRRLLEITTGRHPFQVATVAACPLASLAVLLSGQYPPSLAASLPSPFRDFWLVTLAAAGVLALVGAYWRGDLDNGLLIEGTGVCLTASMLSVYACALILVAGGAGAAAAAFLIAVAVAGWWRTVQIWRDVRKVWNAQRNGLTAQVNMLMEPDTPTPPTPDAA